MNQGLLIVVLLLLVLLFSCKAFNYCVLRELFVNKETVKQMMNDIYGVREHFDCVDEVNCEAERPIRTTDWLREHGCPVENFQNIENFRVMSECEKRYHGSKSESEKARIIADGGCPELNINEGFRCCKDEDDLISGGCQPPMCDGFENYSPFVETYMNIPRVDCETDPSNPQCNILKRKAGI